MQPINIYSFTKGYRSLVKNNIEINNPYVNRTYWDLSSELNVLPNLCRGLYKLVEKDQNFNIFNGYYIGNYLNHTDNYYDGNGMSYQIVTRFIEKLKIIVYKNPQLYYELMDIKYLSYKE